MICGPIAGDEIFRRYRETEHLRMKARRHRVPAKKSRRRELTPPEAPAYREFLDRAKGTLPEIVTEGDLDTLNSALGHLFSLLRLARQQFDEGRNGGRDGAFTALGAYWMFVTLFREPLAESLEVPILRLQDALAKLDDNFVSPIVQPIRRRGRATASYAHANLKGLAAGTVKRLTDLDLSRKEAHRRVAMVLDSLGVRPERGSGRVTPSTVKNWCDEVSSDVGRSGAAAEMYDSMFARAEEQERFAAMSRDDARRHALDIMAHWVRTVFPELQKAS
jgi:hypothetical protein